MITWAVLLAFIFGAGVSALFLGPWYERNGWRRGVIWAENRAPEDLVGIAIENAIRDFGGRDGVFNAAGFSGAFMRLLGLRGVLDGHVVRGILSGRADVLTLDGGAHFKQLRASESNGDDSRSTEGNTKR